MKKYFIVLLCSFSLFTLSQTPREVVQKQLDAYNNHDIDAFMSVFSDNIELWTLGDSIPSVKGFKSTKKIYADLFKRSQNLNSEVLNRTIIGNKVIDYEKISGRSGRGKEEVLYLIMIYEVRDGKIFRATAIRE